VRIIESPGPNPSEGGFLAPNTFHAKVLVRGEGGDHDEVRQFVDVPQTGCNSWCIVDNLFAIGDSDLIPVPIESPEEWYKSKLRRGESTWNSNANSFADEKQSFAFFIWTGEDSHASPSGGMVTGIYKIIRETGPQSAAVGFAMTPGLVVTHGQPAASSGGLGPALVTWKMLVDSAQRQAIVRQ
jgi:hypothetical protein